MSQVKTRKKPVKGLYIVHYRMGKWPCTLATDRSEHAWGVLSMYFDKYAWMEWTA